MKKYIVLAAVAVAALASCAKTEVNSYSPAKEVTFQAVNYMAQTKATGSKFTDDAFGTYAYADASVLAENAFMINEMVTLQNGTWKPSTTYYWPKSGKVDFISYFPFGGTIGKKEGTNPAVTATTINYTDFTVPADTDVRYADKACGYGENVDEVNDGVDSGYEGVPTFFRHALAKINVKIQLAYYEKTVTETSGATTKYEWEVKLNSANISGIYNKGSLALTLGTVGTTPCTAEWTKPAGELWTLDAAKSQIDTTNMGVQALPYTLATDSAYILKDYYVLPQALVANTQEMNLNFTIVTKRNGVEILNETYDYNGVDFLTTVIPDWKINQNTTYILTFAPTAGTGADPTDPTKPIDPTNPNLDDVTITFDPAVDGWNPVNAQVTIKL